jgi:hypothetical protein
MLNAEVNSEQKKIKKIGNSILEKDQQHFRSRADKSSIIQNDDDFNLFPHTCISRLFLAASSAFGMCEMLLETKLVKELNLSSRQL